MPIQSVPIVAITHAQRYPAFLPSFSCYSPLMKFHPLSALLALAVVCTGPSSHAEDVSGGKYAAVYAQRILARSDKNGNGSLETAEADQDWKSLSALDANHDGVLSLDELKLGPINYLACDGEQKRNLLYKKTPQEDLYLDIYNHDDRPDFRDRFGPRITKSSTSAEEKLKLYREMSPIQYLQADSPPLLMIQGDQDTTIPVKHAYYIKDKAALVKAPVEIMIIKNAGHNWRELGASIEPNTDEIVQRTVSFLARQIQTNPPSTTPSLTPVVPTTSPDSAKALPPFTWDRVPVCYTWGYSEIHGTFDWYPEFDKPLGPPQGEAKRSGWTYERKFAHADVFVDLEKQTARIDWKP
jgi:pimeloyl-ACP methyl ester carboxylesterase